VLSNLPPESAWRLKEALLGAIDLTTNPGVNCAKEYERMISPPFLVLLGASDWSIVIFLMSLMTLGNGYLGSRIDEERSEMRYLV
jgi:hypothetical protein